MDKKISLPKGQFIDDTDAEGQGLFPTDDDVEGHGKPSPEDFTVLPPPPGIGGTDRRGTAAKPSTQATTTANQLVPTPGRAATSSTRPSNRRRLPRASAVRPARPQAMTVRS